jgi:hypothetical protein
MRGLAVHASKAGMLDSVPAVALTAWLCELTDGVILRNEEDLIGNIRRGGDVDVLVGDLPRAEQTLLRHLGLPVRIIRSSYVTGYAYEWGQIDLLPTLEWRGACYLAPEAVLEGRRLSARGLPAPRVAHEAVISWLSSVLFGGFFNARYTAAIRKAVDTDGAVFRQSLMEAAGRSWGDRLWQAAVDGCPEISATWTRPLRRAVWWRACFRSPVRTLRRALAFIAGELRLRYAPPVPAFLIAGPDDAQASSLADTVVQRFTGCPFGNVKEFPPRSGTRAPQATAWLTGYWTRLVHLRAKGYILAFRGPWPTAPVSWLLPKPDLVFMLDPTLDMQRGNLYPAAAAAEPVVRGGVRPRPAPHVLDARMPAGILAEQVQRVVCAWMRERTAAGVVLLSNHEEAGR